MKFYIYFSIFTILFFTRCNTSDELRLKKGMTINQSVVIANDIYKINGESSIENPVLVIEGNNIVVDFNGAILQGSNDKKMPNDFYGLGILIRNGQNITIKNLRIKGFKWGILAEEVDSLKIDNTTVSYNYRPRLKSTFQKEDPSDAQNYNQLNDDKWLNNGSAVYLKKCNNAIIKGLKITESTNGLMIAQCDNGLFYNNDIRFNAGLGIALNMSQNNKIMHNRLDWNVKGYSYEVYATGQNSAGIWVDQQSNSNIFAYNSATHCGTGLTLRAGSLMINSEKGGSRHNMIYGNDFSYAPTSGIETFFNEEGDNHIISNVIIGCQYGIKSNYCSKMKVLSNYINDNDVGIIFQNSYNNTIRFNDMLGNDLSLQILESTPKVENQVFLIKKDMSSRDYAISHNLFKQNKTALQISNTDNTRIVMNQFTEVDLILDEKAPNTNLINKRNSINSDIIDPVSDNETRSFAPMPIKDGIDAMNKNGDRQGKKNIIINEWGPYSFRYPLMCLRKVKGKQYVFAIFGPLGNWKLKKATGVERISLKSGTFPSTVVVDKSNDDLPINIELEYIGETFTNQLGIRNEKGNPYEFRFSTNQSNEAKN